MKRAQEIFRPSFVPVGLSGLMWVGLWVLLSGCEPPSGPPGARPAMPPSSISAGPPMPPQPMRHEPQPPVVAPPHMPETKDGVQDNLEKTAEHTDKTPEDHTTTASASAGERKLNPLTPVFKVERAGYTVKLASEVLFSQANPFLDLLSRPSAILPVADTGGVPALPMEPKPPPDPFTQVSLLGVAYNPASPMAVVSLSREEASRLVRRGDILVTDEGRLRIGRIERDGIELETLEKPWGKKTLTLPNVIGYVPGGTKEEKSAPTEEKPPATEAGASPTVPLGATLPANMMTPGVASPEMMTVFRNLKKLAGEGLKKQQPSSSTNPVSKL